MAREVLLALAYVGVPAAVVFGTGGIFTFGFWLNAVFMIPVVGAMAGLLGVLLLLPLAPIVVVVEKLSPKLVDRILQRICTGAYVAAGVAGYLYGPDLGNASAMRLPTPWVNLSVLIVIGAAALTSNRLVWLASRFEIRRQVASEPRQATGPNAAVTWAQGQPNPYWEEVEEPDEEFWSHEPIVAWRAWRWTGAVLRGVYTDWKSSHLEADCSECPQVPNWHHACGIYAVKEPADLPLFNFGAFIIGRVVMWGDVIEHDDGYRASHARIIDIWTNSEELVDSIRERYPGLHVRLGTPVGPGKRHGE